MNFIELNGKFYNLDNITEISKTVLGEGSTTRYAIILDDITIEYYPNLDSDNYRRKMGYTVNASTHPVPERMDFESYYSDSIIKSEEMMIEDWNKLMDKIN